MEVCEPRDIHRQLTLFNQLTYCFTPKHHGVGSKSKSDSQWPPNLPRPEEFAVFDMADIHQLADPDGNLYGLRIRQAGERHEILELGTRHEYIARFWAEEHERHWHGHPLWPIQARDALNRARQKYCPSREVFNRMVAEGLLTEPQARRLKLGWCLTVAEQGKSLVSMTLLTRARPFVPGITEVSP
jgi:hypothetical protein